MSYWYLPPGIAVMLVLMTTFWIATAQEEHCDIFAAVFLIVCTPVLIGLWCIFYLLSYLP
jgi:hypothetical protein